MDDTNISYELLPCNIDKVLNFETSTSLKLTHINIRSLVKNIDNLKLLYEDSINTKFDIIGLSEVWNASNTSVLNLQGYTLEVDCRKDDLRGGGVGAYIKSNLKYNRLNYDIAHAESLWLQVNTAVELKIIIAVIYRKPNTNVKEFQNSLLDILQIIKVDKHKCVLLGDFNVNILSVEDMIADDFISSLQCVGLEQLIKSPTRVTKDSSTLIDHIYSNVDTGETHSGVIHTDISDHFAVFVVFTNMAKLCSNQKKITYRCYRKFNIEQFKEDLYVFNWEEVLNCHDVNIAYSMFCKSFSNICNKHAPMKTKQIGKKKDIKKKAWITTGIMKSIRVKQKLYAKVLKTNYNDDIVKKYKKYRNLLTTVLKNAKRTYYSNLLYENRRDTSKTWDIINELLVGKKKMSKVAEVDRLIKKVNGDNNLITSTYDIVNEFNNYFINIGPNLADTLPNETVSHRRYLGTRVDNSIFWKPVTEDEVFNHLVTLDVKKACGHDNLPARLLRDSAVYISGVLAYIFNLSLECGRVPDEMKIAKVTPIHKKGPKDEPGNYRPISVLPVLGKVFEKVTNGRLVQFLETNNAFYKHQYGFRKKYSTKLSLINLSNTILKAIDESKATLGIFIDFKKAFDTINHNVLINKLSHYGIRGLPLKWFEDYLRGRYQFVQYGETVSMKMKITCGVPQGSVLGPTLFLLYINDLPSVSNYFNFRLFADDSNLFHTFPAGQDEIDVNEVNINIKKIQEWCVANKLTINSMKTKFMLKEKY